MASSRGEALRQDALVKERAKAREEYEASGHLWAGMAPTIRNPGPYTDFLTSVVKVCFSHTSLEIIDL